jgi:ribosomal protein S18 acetylase RimI-like enzyme
MAPPARGVGAREHAITRAMDAGAQDAITLRRMREDEAAATCALWTRSKKRAYPWLAIEQARTPADDWGYFSGTLCQRCELWVALRGERIAGMMALDGAHVDQLFIDPADQGSGVGSALLAHAKTLHPRGLSLFTFQRNGRARAFYEARGFRAVRFGVSPAPESEPDVRYEWP